MNVKKLVIPIILLFIIIILLVPFVNAQNIPCPGPGTRIRMIDGLGNNVRTLPGGISTIVKTIHFSDGEFIVTEVKTVGSVDYLNIGIGWIWNKNININCNGSLPTVTLVATPTRIIPTPTSNPTATPRVDWICDRKHCSEFELPYRICDGDCR